MSKLSLKKIKERLIAERENVIDKLRGSERSIDDSETPDPVDLAVKNYSKNVMMAVSENDSRQLVLINEALERIEDEEYGLCQNCENKITPNRMNAVPWARYCINCQELQEKGLLDED